MLVEKYWLSYGKSERLLLQEEYIKEVQGEMSRIGRMPIAIPAGVTVEIAENNKVTVKGPKGTLERVLPAEMDDQAGRRRNPRKQTKRLKEDEITYMVLQELSFTTW